MDGSIKNTCKNLSSFMDQDDIFKQYKQSGECLRKSVRLLVVDLSGKFSSKKYSNEFPLTFLIE
jgi:hypothetical protein